MCNKRCILDVQRAGTNVAGEAGVLDVNIEADKKQLKRPIAR